MKLVHENNSLQNAISDTYQLRKNDKGHQKNLQEPLNFPNCLGALEGKRGHGSASKIRIFMF